VTRWRIRINQKAGTWATDVPLSPRGVSPAGLRIWICRPYYRKGEVVHALCDGLGGLEGFRRIFSWDGGEVFLEAGVHPDTETIGLPWHGLLVRMMAEREGQSSHSSALHQEGAASRAMRFHRLYSHALAWNEVHSCFIYCRRKLRIERPRSTVPALQAWSRMFVELLQKAGVLRVLDGDQQPHLICVTAAGTHWVLIPEDSFFVALEVRRGVDADGLFRRVKAVLNEAD
jgi:hypothetical protein